MPNKNYQKGLRKEYAIVKLFKETGCDIVQRTAGSHSPIDIIAINKSLKTIFLIQAKPDSMSEKEKQKIEDEFSWLNDEYYVRYKVR